jgi:transposase-like protein
MIKQQCYHCQSENLVRNGKTRNGKQRFLCNDCGRRSRDNPQPLGYSELEKATILRAYQERSSLRGLTRTFGVARNTVSTWLKKNG